MRADRIVREIERLLGDAGAYAAMAQGASPYGDGNAAAADRFCARFGPPAQLAYDSHFAPARTVIAMTSAPSPAEDDRAPNARTTITDSPIGVTPRVRPVELWIPAAIAITVGLRWLLGERHSVYGDEAFHLTNLLDGVAAATGGLVDRFVALYLFNFAYPPVFHLLSAPFVLPAADPVAGGAGLRSGAHAPRLPDALQRDPPHRRKDRRHRRRAHPFGDAVICRREPPLSARAAPHARGSPHSLLHRPVLRATSTSISDGHLRRDHRRGC